MFAQYASLPRLFVEEPLAQGKTLRLGRAASHYLATVLRRQEGDLVRFFNESDGEYLARLLVSSSKGCQIEINQHLRPYEPTPPLGLVFSPLRKERMHFLIEKAVELGVTSLMPMYTTRTTHRSFHRERAKSHAIEAIEQSEHMTVPHIEEAVTLPDLLINWKKTEPIFFCKERSGAEPLAQALLNHDACSPTFLVGPEGGFTTEECLLLESYSFVHPVSLGYHILRSETAALSALGFWKLYYKAQTEWEEKPC